LRGLVPHYLSPLTLNALQKPRYLQSTAMTDLFPGKLGKA